jgi:hypothetical protein
VGYIIIFGGKTDILRKNMPALLIQAAPLVKAVFQRNDTFLTTIRDYVIVGFGEEILNLDDITATKGAGLNIRLYKPRSEIVLTAFSFLHPEFGLVEQLRAVIIP